MEVEEARAGRRDDDPSAPLSMSLLFLSLYRSHFPISSKPPLIRQPPLFLGRLGDEIVYGTQGFDRLLAICVRPDLYYVCLYFYLPLYRIRGI